MQRDNKISFFLGTLGYLAFFATLFLIRDIEFGALLLALFISIFILSVTIWLIAKITNIKIKLGSVIVGSLLTAVLLKVVELITGWPDMSIIYK